MTGRNQVVALSFDGPWVAAPFCFPQTAQREQKARFCSSKHMYVAETPNGQRVIALVHLGLRGKHREPLTKKPGRLRAFWMDAITGTLYNLRTGASISSDDNFLWDIRKDAQAIDQLINKKFSQPSG